MKRNIARVVDFIHRKTRDALPSGRNVEVKLDDVFIVSYPKSGNTWMRFMLANVLTDNADVGFVNIEEIVPDIYINSNRVLGGMSSPRYLKSHEYFDPRYKKVIYIVRDPRDVAISYYHHLLKMREIDDDASFDEYVNDFVGGQLDGYGSWGENVTSWMCFEDTRRVLCVRYEDMVDNTEYVLEKVLRFLDLDFSGQEIKLAVSNSRIEKMANLEKIQASHWKATRKSRLDKRFVRKGKPGEWRAVLSKDHVEMIEKEWGPVMAKFYYN